MRRESHVRFGGRTAETHSLRDEQGAAVRPYTYISTGSGFLYLSVVLDAWSRRVVGWAMANHMRTQLVFDALDMALYRRRPKKVIHHSDHGSQYTALAFGKRCRQAGVRPSMGSVGDCYDNALCESFFATLERELLDRHRFATQSQAQLTVFKYLEGDFTDSFPFGFYTLDK